MRHTYTVHVTKEHIREDWARQRLLRKEVGAHIDRTMPTMDAPCGCAVWEAMAEAGVPVTTLGFGVVSLFGGACVPLYSVDEAVADLINEQDNCVSTPFALPPRPLTFEITLSDEEER